MPRRGPHNSAITWTPYLRVAWGGKFVGTPEVWTNSLKFVYLSNLVPTVTQIQAMYTGVWAALSKWMTANSGTDGASLISSDATLNWLKINPINGDGLQYPGDTLVYEPGTPVAGAAAPTAAYYETWALTLNTGLKRGRAHAGRIFPPAVVGVITTGGQQNINAAAFQALGLAKAMLSMQTAIRTASDVGSFSVCSPGNSVKGTTPKSTIITGVTCDTIPDVQHRRTNRLIAARSALQPIPA